MSDDCKVCGKHFANYQPFEFCPKERVCMSCLDWLDKTLRAAHVILTTTGKLIACPF